jgi:hypothetical protein
LEEYLINDNTIGLVLMTPDDYGKSNRELEGKVLQFIKIKDYGKESYLSIQKTYLLELTFVKPQRNITV